MSSPNQNIVPYTLPPNNDNNGEGVLQTPTLSSKADKDAQKNVEVSFKYSCLCFNHVVYVIVTRFPKLTSVTSSGKFAQLAFFPENFTLQFLFLFLLPGFFCKLYFSRI
jgi:hypothetical protein